MAAALSQQQDLQERLRLREERKQQEELMKAFETPEEKRARRLAKKEAKERKKREKMGWGEEYMGYTNTDNPFGDNNLLGTFIWNKVSPAQPWSAWWLALCLCQIFPALLFSLCVLFTTSLSRDVSTHSTHSQTAFCHAEFVLYTHTYTGFARFYSVNCLLQCNISVML